MITGSAVHFLGKENIVPQSELKLRHLRTLVDDFLQTKKLTPPLQQETLIDIATEFVGKNPDYEKYIKLVAILVNNFAWKPTVETIPNNKRVLLLPKCIRNSVSCSAKMDELGLLCEFCGGCNIQNYIEEAEEMGYHVIVSEGTGAVQVLLASGQIECVIGVACLDSFERSFPLSVKQAIPSIAIPLYNVDCRDSRTDENWLRETLNLKSDSKPLVQLDFNQQKKKVDKWFSDEYLSGLFPPVNESTLIANKWLQAGGKRWRPLIMSVLQETMAGESRIEEDKIAKLAIAIECFHKASLAHDDIADEDTDRYGEDSLLKKHGTAITLNTGDLLLSYGYQLIAQAGFEPVKTQKLLSEAAIAHRELCLGQGEELLWSKAKKMPPVDKVIEIFKGKTAPAFEVALKFGAIAVNEDENLLGILSKYSEAIGIAYQIKDDIDDFNPENANNDVAYYRPSIILALLNESNPLKMMSLMKNEEESVSSFSEDIYNWAVASGVIDKAKELLEEYRVNALAALENLEDVSTKVLLCRLLAKIV